MSDVDAVPVDAVPIVALNCPRSRCDWVCGVAYPGSHLDELRVTHKAHRKEDWDTWPEEPVYMGIRRWREHKVMLPSGERLGHYEFQADGSLHMMVEDQLVMAVAEAS